MANVLQSAVALSYINPVWKSLLWLGSSRTFTVREPSLSGGTGRRRGLALLGTMQ